MKITNALKQRFVKDYNLPINIFEDDLFEYYLKELDEQYDTIKKYESFKDFLNKYETEEDFFQASTKIIDNILEYVSNKEDYKKLELDRLENLNQVKNYPSKNIYNLENVGNYYISLDLIKANFQALKKYSKKIVFNCETYEDFISKFTNEDYLKNSKQIRQVVFGNLLPKKQQIIQKDIMFGIYNTLLENDIKNIVSVMSDEIVIQCENKEDMDFKKNKISQLDFKGFEIRIDAYKLNNIHNRKYFVREFDDGTFDFKCIPSNLLLQAYKIYLNQPLKPEDLMFFHEGVKAQYLESIFTKDVSYNIEDTNTIEVKDI